MTTTTRSMGLWYRTYVGTVSDPKFAEAAIIANCSVSVAYTAFQCMLESAAETRDKGRFRATPRNVAATLREQVETVERVFAAFEELGMAKNSTVLSWSKRQYESDSSTERSRKHRAGKAKGPETGARNACNVAATPPQQLATPPDTETDTDNIPPNPQRGDVGVLEKNSKQPTSRPRRTATQNFWADALGLPPDDPECQFVDGKVVASDRLRAEWAEYFDGNLRELQLAMVELSVGYKPSSRTPLRAQCERKLASMARRREQQKQNYVQARAVSDSTPEDRYIAEMKRKAAARLQQAAAVQENQSAQVQ